MRLGQGWIAAPLLAVVLLVAVVGSASAAGGSDELVSSADQSGESGVVVIAQSDVDPDTERRLVDRETSERVDAVVIALWSIAAGMTVMLMLFLWHTSPRRRLRLARRRSTNLYEPEGAEFEDSAEDGPAEDSEVVEGDVAEGAAVEVVKGDVARPIEVEVVKGDVAGPAEGSEVVKGDVAEGAAVEVVEAELDDAVEVEVAAELAVGETVEAVEVGPVEIGPIDGEVAAGGAVESAGEKLRNVRSRLWAWLKDLT